VFLVSYGDGDVFIVEDEGGVSASELTQRHDCFFALLCLCLFQMRAALGWEIERVDEGQEGLLARVLGQSWQEVCVCVYKYHLITHFPF